MNHSANNTSSYNLPVTSLHRSPHFESSLTVPHREYLRNNAISDAVIKKAKLFSADPEEAERLVGIAEGGIMFPYYDMDGNIIGHRLRLDKPRIFADGKTMRYKQPARTSLSCYFMLNAIPALKDQRQPLYVTEGEKKALAIASCAGQSDKAIVSMPGCWNFKAKGEKDFTESWLKIPLSRREVTFVPDSDFYFNAQVHEAGITFIRLLMKAGAKKVHLINLTTGSEDK